MGKMPTSTTNRDKIAKGLESCSMLNGKTCFDCTYDGANTHGGMLECVTLMCRDAYEQMKSDKEAIEAFLPTKEPIKMEKDYGNVKSFEWGCPKCRFGIGYKWEHCPRCGQRIEWSKYAR